MEKAIASPDENVIIRLVDEVDYTRTPEEAIKATHRVECLDNLVVESMPARGDGIRKDV